jgi:hypothetical protein
VGAIRKSTQPNLREDIGDGTGIPREPQLEGERRHLTVMFTDLVDFTVMGESLGEESVFALTKRIAAQRRETDPAHRRYALGEITKNQVQSGSGVAYNVAEQEESVRPQACRNALTPQNG